MKFYQRGKHAFFRAGSARFLLWSASQRGYFNNSRNDDENHGEVGHLASLESMSMIILNPWHSRETDRETMTNYCVTDAP